MNTSNLSPRQFVNILVERCPAYMQALPSCPLKKLRAMPEVVDRRAAVAAMSDGEVQELYALHMECLLQVCGS